MLSLSPTLSFFIYTPSSIPSTLFTLYSPLYSGLLRVTGLPGYRVTRVTGLLGLPGYSGYSSANHLPFIIIITCLTHLIFILHPRLYSPLLTLLITPLTYHFPFIILAFILPRHYFPYSSSHISIYSHLYSPPNLLFNIFSITHLLTLLNSPLYIPNYLLTSLFPQLTFIYSPLLLLPLLISSLSYSPYPIQHYFPYSSPLYPFLYHIKSLLTLIFTTQLIPLLLQKILPLKSFSFPFYYSLFPISN